MKAEIPVYNITSFSEFRHEDILVSRLSSYWESHKDLYNSHRHNFYHLVLFTKGKGYHTIDFQIFPVKDFQIYFMVPGQVHSWDFGEDVDGYVINFSIPFFQYFLLKPDLLDEFTFFSGSVNDCVLQIPLEMEEKFRGIFEDILSEGTENRYFNLHLVRTLLLQIFILVSRLNSAPWHESDSSYNYTLLKNFRKLIENNFTKLKLPKEYAELLYITPNHLNALCNHLLGLPAGQIIRERLFLEAKRLLVNYELSISEISDRLNFKDNSYFSKSFRKHTGFSPEEFRKRN